MSKKSFVVILIFSVIATYGVASLDLVFNVSKGRLIGLPFGFSSFNFFGSETESTMLLLDVVFWFLIIWGIWKLFKKVIDRK